MRGGKGGGEGEGKNIIHFFFLLCVSSLYEGDDQLGEFLEECRNVFKTEMDRQVGREGSTITQCS